jgi:cytochrome b561
MLVKDTKDQYGGVSVFLHWLIAAVVITLLATGTFGFFSGRGAARTNVLDFHLSLAAAVAPFILFRFYWRMKHGKPKLPPQHPALEFAASAVWRILLFGMLCQLVTGPILTWAHNHWVGIMGVIEIPSPYPPLTPAELARIYAVADFFHALVGFTIAGAVSLHILGALKHGLVDRDGVLRRMLVPGAAHAKKPAVRAAEGLAAE